MGDHPGVSVIIPTYNRAQYVGEAIESVLSQSYSDYEVIVVDDGSSDDTAAVVSRFPTVRYVHQENAGIGAARNQGVAMARGAYLAFLDSDDLWPREKLMIQTQAMAETPEIDVLYAHARQFVSPDTSAGVNDVLRFVDDPVPGYVPGTMLVKSATFARVGPFPVAWKVGEAVDWHLRATEQHLHIELLPHVLLFRRLHDTNQGRVHRDSRSDYLHILKASLDRRRASEKGVNDEPGTHHTGAEDPH